MPVLTELIDALRTGRVEVIDLTAPLHSGTPILQLPPPFANASPFGLTEISHYDERGPAWYWNDIHTSRAHRHPLRRPGPLGDRQGRRRRGRRCRPPGWSRRPRCWTSPPRPTRTSCSRSSTSRRGRPSTARCPMVAGCSTGPAGTPAARTRRRSSTQTRPARTPRASRWPAPAGWPTESPVLGVGVETVGTDAGAAHSFDPPFPCHSFLLGAEQVRADPAAEPGPAAGHRRGGDRRAAADRERLGQPGPGAGAGRA